MNNIVGIRHEDKYKQERRVALTPKHVEKLVKDQKLKVLVQSSGKRIFKDKEYEKAGAIISDSLKKCPVIFGVKEIPISSLEPDKTYVIFSHVIKGQKYNMPMLKKMMELKSNLIDYEKIVDEQGRRLIFFGKFAGLAGMINSLWALGLRLKYKGYDTPFLKIKQAHLYDSLEQAKKTISEVGQEIAEKGLPKDLTPFVIGFTGYGNVSGGAQEICNLLASKEILPDELLELQNKTHLPDNIIYKVVFKEEHLFQPKDKNQKFELQDYYDNPQKYKNQFEKYIPILNLLINCIYWTEKYPKIITQDYLEKLFSKGVPKLTIIGDISCDINGSIGSTVRASEIDNPIYVYNPFTRNIKSGYKGEGLLMMTVDILPSELPAESSISFGNALFKYVKPIVNADYNVDFEKVKLPNTIKKAMILHKGNLTPDYQYISQYLK